MLEFRPNYEQCDKGLPPNSLIYTFECTFCSDCISGILLGVCLNCGGNFEPWAIRPSEILEKFPPSSKRVVRS
ncbi:MAG: DUF1272 domain-containing protein [Gammaproteobacteria bacterium]|nr:DUF1272 domain-containing protein [Gammaproteobacteria bacterium]